MKTQYSHNHKKKIQKSPRKFSTRKNNHKCVRTSLGRVRVTENGGATGAQSRGAQAGPQSRPAEPRLKMGPRLRGAVGGGARPRSLRPLPELRDGFFRVVCVCFFRNGCIFWKLGLMFFVVCENVFFFKVMNLFYFCTFLFISLKWYFVHIVYQLIFTIFPRKYLNVIYSVGFEYWIFFWNVWSFSLVLSRVWFLLIPMQRCSLWPFLKIYSCSQSISKLLIYIFYSIVNTMIYVELFRIWIMRYLHYLSTTLCALFETILS